MVDDLAWVSPRMGVVGPHLPHLDHFVDADRIRLSPLAGSGPAVARPAV